MTRRVWTREEEEARCVEIEAMKLSPGNNLQKTYRAHMERKWMLEDAGVADLGEHRMERFMARCDRDMARKRFMGELDDEE